MRLSGHAVPDDREEADFLARRGQRAGDGLRLRDARSPDVNGEMSMTGTVSNATAQSCNGVTSRHG